MRWPKREPAFARVDPAEPGPVEVFIRVGAAGVCHSDLHVLDAPDARGMPIPLTLGHEDAGWIEAPGAGRGPRAVVAGRYVFRNWFEDAGWQWGRPRHYVLALGLAALTAHRTGVPIIAVSQRMLSPPRLHRVPIQ